MPTENKTQRYTFKGAAGEYVYANDFDRVTAERDALQSEIKGIKEGIGYRGSLFGKVQAERDALQSEVERLTATNRQNKLVIDGLSIENTDLQSELTSANADKEAYAQNAIDLRTRVDGLQSELTKALGYLEEIQKHHRGKLGFMHSAIAEFLAHQSAPAAKDGEL